MLARLLGLEAAKVERALMLFLAVLVEIGAALGLYFATGHMRPETSGVTARGRGPKVIEGEVVTDIPHAKPARLHARQIAAAVPRRVPRLKQT